jgi:tRNA uracil 4-sulfurtransferase
MKTAKNQREKPLSRFRPTHLIVHYNEVALKGKNRAWFEEILAQNVRLALAGKGAARVERLFGRLRVTLEEGAEWRRAASALAGVFGIASILPVVAVTPTLDAMQDAAAEAVSGGDAPRSFGVKARRATKSFPFTSVDIQRAVGGRVQEVTGWPVDLDEPELWIRIEVVNRAAFIALGGIAGPGGLPTGVARKVACLLSGGIDSPVAAYRILRRGATAVYVHFHSHPHTGLESQEKVRDLAEIIQPRGRRSRLYLVPFAALQRKIVAGCPAALRVILYRRFMVRAAQVVAIREGALALVTGENLGQVASQTLENLRTIDRVAVMPILRPLIGMDKLEIVEEARRIGTYETSIEPHDDCCSFLLPPHPATQSEPEDLEAAEAGLDTAAETETMVAEAAIVDVGETSPATLEGKE